MRFDAAGYTGCEDIAVHRERTAGLNSRIIGTLENHRAEHAHLRLEKAVRVGDLGTLEGIRADELCEAVSSMRRSCADWPHLVKRYPVAALSELPCGFRAREPAADHCRRIPIFHQGNLRSASLDGAGFLLRGRQTAIASAGTSAGSHSFAQLMHRRY